MARNGLRRLAEGRLGPITALIERLDSANPRILRVLTYHRVDEAAPFALQMDYLAGRYQAVSIARVLAALDGGPALPPRAVLLSFDDAYRSFGEVAWPILAARALPAVLFVPTAYPDGREPRFWWDRLEQAFARSPRRAALPTPLGLLPLATVAERARAHALVKAHVKDLPHAEALAATERLCLDLEVDSGAHEVLGWDELRALARQGVTLGAHTRTHPRLDRIPRTRAREEILGSVRDMEREVPGQPRVFAYPDGRFDDELVELVRAAGVELAFTTRRGTNDLRASDHLRLRRIHVDARDSVAVLRAKLAFSAARLAALARLFDPPTPREREAQRSSRRERRRSRLVLRSLDAALTASLLPPARALDSLRRAASPRSSQYERVGRMVRLACDAAPALEPRLARALLDTTRLPVRSARLQLAGFGSGTTVFRMESPDAAWAPRALKIYRRTLGRDPAHLAGAARRYRERYRRLCAGFGAIVLPAEFLVLHAPLRRVPAVACVQPWLEGRPRDLLALADAELLALLSVHDGLEESFAGFARSALAWHGAGSFPDLVGRGNLVVAEERSGARLRLIDYGIFHPWDAPAADVTRAKLDALALRLERLLGSLGARTMSDAALPG